MRKTDLYKQISLSFDQGTLLLRDASDIQLPEINDSSVWIWDNRIGAMRCDAIYYSAVSRVLHEKFGNKRGGWQLIREGEILHEYQKTFVPDFTFRHDDGTEVLLEIVGFWTPEYLASRHETLKQYKNRKIIVAVNEKILKQGAKMPEHFLTYKTTIKLEPLLEIMENFRMKNKTAI